MRRTPTWRALCLYGLVGSGLLVACANDFPPASRISSLRVLAVRPQPASGVPGEPVQLDMLAYDGRSSAPEAGRPPPFQVVWVAGCHNPPSRQFYACYPLLQGVARQLAEASGENAPLTEVPGLVGLGTEFSFTIPEDILQSAPRLDTDPIHFGVSYVFFAACAGELRLQPDKQDRLPVGCFDAEDGHELGSRDYVEGFTTVYTYEGVVNQNPILTDLRFAGGELTLGECETDADCQARAEDLEGFNDYACSASGSCVPVVTRCEPGSGDNCPEYDVTPLVDPASAEPDPGAPRQDGGSSGEILWAKFYADAGEFSSETRLVHDRESGWVSNQKSRWRPFRREAGSVQLFTTLHDNRGGADWRAFEVLVQDP